MAEGKAKGQKTNKEKQRTGRQMMPMMQNQTRDGWIDGWRKILGDNSRGHGPTALFSRNPYQQRLIFVD